jgi:hypothetical protein
MAIKTKDHYVIHERRRFNFHGYPQGGRYHPSEWVSERDLRSRDFELSQAPDEVAVESYREVTTLRSGRGSLRGKLFMADDWDSSVVNSEIARDFGLEP